MRVEVGLVVWLVEVGELEVGGLNGFGVFHALGMQLGNIWKVSWMNGFM